MATARTLSPGLQLSATWRSFQLAVLLALAATACAGVMYLVETYGLGARHRFIESPAEVMMRAFGVAHFVIGWLFMATSARLRSPRALVKVGILTLLGAGLCLGSWALGGISHPFVLMAFYASFLLHEIRDEANLFVGYGDAPTEVGRDELLQRLGTSVALGMMTAFLFIYTAFGRVQERLERVVADAEPWLLLALGVLSLATVASGWSTWRCLRRYGLNARSFTPLFAVYATIGGILALGSLLGSFGFTLIVLIHVMAWFVFVSQRQSHQATTSHTLWTWLRTTPAGFITLHLVIAGIVLVLLALRVHLWERAGVVSQMLSASSFHYWAILHITIAYWKK